MAGICRFRNYALVALWSWIILFGQLETITAQAVPADTLHLTLAEVLSRIRTTDPVSQAGGADVAAARARAAALLRHENPTLEVDRAALSEADIRLMQPVRWPGESRALRALGRVEISAAQSEATAVLGAFALELSERYADGLRQDRLVELAIEAESLARRALDHAVAARELGQAGDLTVLEAQVSLDASQRVHLAVQLDREASTSGLAVLLGESPERPIAFAEDLANLAPIAAPESALVLGSASDPEAQRLQSAADRSRYEADLHRVLKWPRLGIGPALGLGDRTIVGVALGISLPLWDRQGDAIRAAEADRHAALARLGARRRQLTVLVLGASKALARADQELTLLRSGELMRAEQAESLASGALKQGGPYLAAWLAAHRAYLDARRAELDLEWQAARARLALRHLSGTLLTEEQR